MLAFMSEKHERLREARVNAGYRHASAAANALGVLASTYRAHENGQNDFGLEEAAVYAKKFGVDPLWLMATALERPASADGALVNADTAEQRRVHLPNATVRDSIVGYGRKIPVYGRAVGGVDGEFEMNGSTLYEVMAPPILSGVTKAYAVLVSGESMSPRYEDGEICFVDPTRRVRRGDYVIAQIQRENDPVPLAYVKRFLRWNSKELVLEQFNPAKELRFDASRVVSVHYVALAGNA